jgi:ATP-dependent Lhr-like helicase
MNLVAAPGQQWATVFAALVADRRAVTVQAPAGLMWSAVERVPAIAALFPGAVIEPAGTWPPRRGLAGPAEVDEDDAAASLLRGHLECRGPSTVAALAETTGLAGADPARAGGAGAGGFRDQRPFHRPDADEEYCARRLLARIHGYSRERRRREIEPVTARDFMRFLLRWQHVTPDSRREGRFGVLAVVEQLQGFELAAGAWEHQVLAARVAGYRREWLDELCLSGQVSWGRLSVRDADPDATPRTGRPSRATPITLALRDDLPWLLRAARGDLTRRSPEAAGSLAVLGAPRPRGVVPARPGHGDRAAARRVDRALWDSVARGRVTADGFRAVRALLRRGSRQPFAQPRGLRRGLAGTTGGASRRWSPLPGPLATGDRDELAEAVAEQLAARWGVVFRDLVVRENLAVPWRDVLWAFRRMEARGTIRGGRFVTGFSGEQYAHPDAIDVLRAVRKQPRKGEIVRISAADPLNLAGIVLPGPRVPAIAANTVSYLDGVAHDASADDGGPMRPPTRPQPLDFQPQRMRAGDRRLGGRSGHSPPARAGERRIGRAFPRPQLIAALPVSRTGQVI